MADILTLSATLFGQSGYIWPSFVVGETVNINLTCLDPSTGLALNLSTSAVIWTMANQITNVTIISRQANITSGPGGLCTIPIVSGDTASVGAVVPSGNYNVDCWAEDVSGNRVDLAYGTMYLAPAYRLPLAPITPLASQLPLAQGPAGGSAGSFSTFSLFPSAASAANLFAYAQDTALLYYSNGTAWWPVVRCS